MHIIQGMIADKSRNDRIEMVMALLMALLVNTVKREVSKRWKFHQ